MSDLGGDAWPFFLCVEAGQVGLVWRARTAKRFALAEMRYRVQECLSSRLYWVPHPLPLK
jgi:hypothetical protein